MTTTAKLAVATSILSLFLGMFIGQQATKDKYRFRVPDYVIYTPKETKIKIEIRDTLMSAYSLHITKADWLADNVLIAHQIYGAPIDIMLALISVESEFDEFAVSSSNAVGFTQIRPSVWEDNLPYDIYNPAENILGGAHILYNYKKDCGNWECALKAYNIGITNYNDGENKSAAKRYVKKIVTELKRLVTANANYKETVKRG